MTDSQNQQKMMVIQEGNVAKKALKYTVFDPRKSLSHPLLLNDILVYLFQRSACNQPLLRVQHI